MLNQWKEKQIKMYERYAANWRKSDFRLNSLENLIKLLNNYGNVILLRMPIDQEIVNLENNYWPDFNATISKITKRTNTNYLDFTKKNNMYKTYDGNHLDKYGGVTFTKNLCDSITKRIIINKEND